MATIRNRRGKFQVQVRRAGHSAISKTFHALADARRWARAMERDADSGSVPDLKKLREIALGDLVRRYRDTITPQKRSAANERWFLSAFLKHPICRKRLLELSADHFAAYRDERLHFARLSTVKRDFTRLRHMFNLARDQWGLPLDNPISKLSFKGADQRRERRLKPGELERLLLAARECRNSLIPPVIRLAIETAMRRGEILAIRLDHFDQTTRTLRIPETKNGHSRTIPLTTTAAALLSGLDLDPLFPISANAFRLAWDRLKARAGVEDLHFHDLRHEAISRFFERGLSVPEVALISGHRDPRMLFRYTHPSAELIARKLND